MNLFDMTTEEYKLFHKVEKLRRKIQARNIELNIQPAHEERGHFYTFQENKYPSVTGMLQILKDPGLMNWKMNRACDYIVENFQNINSENLELIIQQAKQAPQLEFEEAGSIGTAVHNMREMAYAAMIEGKDREFSFAITTTDTAPGVISGFRAIKKFTEETNYTPLACELYLADPTLEIGGTGDDIGILDGKVGFMDLKTSNIGDKDSYFYQVALYVYMFEKLYGIRTHWHKILHVSKTDGTYKLIDIPDIRKRIKEAKQIIKVSKFLESLKQEKKKVPIII